MLVKGSGCSVRQPEVTFWVYVRVCPPPRLYIHVIFNLYNKLNKFIAFRNVTKLSMYGRDLCNEVRRDRNQSNKAMLTL